MYTLEDLAHIVKQAGDTDPLPTIKRRIEGWYKHDRVLPQPERPPIPGKRGRGPLVFPESAHAAVLWLAAHRRFIVVADVAKYWMWLDGFDYITVDLNRVVMQACDAQWNALRKQAPSLPSLPILSEDPDALEAAREHILDEYDAQVLWPKYQRGELPGEQLEVTVACAAMIGLPYELLDPVEGEEPGHAVPSHVGAFRRALNRSRRIGRPVDPTDGQGMHEIVAVATLPKLYAAAANEAINWEQVRNTWWFSKTRFAQYGHQLIALCKYDVKLPVAMSLRDCLKSPMRIAERG